MEKNKIILQGLYSEKVFGGVFKLLRGYATLSDLESISIPYYIDEGGFQRKTNAKHAEEIKEYFEKGNNKFIPEIILGARLNKEEYVIRPGRAYNRIRKANSSSNISGAIGQSLDSGEITSFTINLKELRKKPMTIRRIDGNHRLFLARDLEEDTNNPNKYLVPFCLIILDDEDNKYDDIAEALIFYNINQKAIPLASEHGYKILLNTNNKENVLYGESRLFEEDKILYAAQLFNNLINKHTDIYNIFEEKNIEGIQEPFTKIYNLVKLLNENDFFDSNNDKKKLEDKINKIFKDLNAVFSWAKIEQLSITKYYEIIPAILFILKEIADFKDENIEKVKYWLKSYDKWLTKSKLLGNFKTSQPDVIWRIFKDWKNSQPKKVFIACSFREEKTMEMTRKMIKEAIDNFNEKHKEIKLEHIRIDESHGTSFELAKGIFDSIDEAEFVIADLTDERPNVYCEIGYAKSKNKDFILTFHSKSKEDTENKNKVHVDLLPYKYVDYSSDGDLRDKLIKEIEGYYDFKD